MRRWRLVGSRSAAHWATKRRGARRHPGRLVGVRLPVEPRHQLEDAEPVAVGPVRARLEHHVVDEVGCEGLAPLAAVLGHVALALGLGPGPGPDGALELADPGGHQVVERGVVDEAGFEATARRPAARHARPPRRNVPGSPMVKLSRPPLSSSALVVMAPRRAWCGGPEHLVRVRAGHELVDEPRGHAVGWGPARDAPARVGEPGGHVGEVGLDVDAGVGHAIGEVVGQDAELLDPARSSSGVPPAGPPLAITRWGSGSNAARRRGPTTTGPRGRRRRRCGCAGSPGAPRPRREE